MAEQRNAPKVVKGPGGRRNMQPGMKPSVENPGKVMKRLFSYVAKDYGVVFLIVLACIVISGLANAQGTMFMQTLIDQYITPMIGQKNPDFGPLLKAMSRVVIFYAIGVTAAFTQNRIMVKVTQGTMKNLRKELFDHMETLPIKYFDTHAHGDIMSIYTNDIDTLRQVISQSAPQLVNSAITIVTVLVCMLRLSVALTIVTLLMVVLMLFVTKTVAGRSGSHFMQQQKDIGAVNGYIE